MSRSTNPTLLKQISSDLTPTPPLDMASSVTQLRVDLMRRATSLMDAPAGVPFVEQFDALPRLSALLMTSLEELKVAEEELREQNAALLAQRAEVDAQVNHYRQLFVRAPIPAFVTDPFGTIHDANLAAGRLFRREAAYLDGKPLQALMPAESREAFRRQLARLSSDDGVEDWRMTLQRVGDTPVRVSAAVHFVPGVGRTGSGALYWMLRVVEPAD